MSDKPMSQTIVAPPSDPEALTEFIVFFCRDPKGAVGDGTWGFVSAPSTGGFAFPLMLLDGRDLDKASQWVRGQADSLGLEVHAVRFTREAGTDAVFTYSPAPAPGPGGYL